MRALLMLPLLILLSACQNAQLSSDYDPHLDFANYHTWRWHEPAVQFSPNDPRIRSGLTAARVQAAVEQQLPERGLQQSTSGKADLTVSVWLIVDQHQEQVTTQTGGAWGYPWGGYWGPGYVDTRTLDYQVGTLQIDLHDSKDGKLIWRGSLEKILGNNDYTPSERAAIITHSVHEVLSQYPPN